MADRPIIRQSHLETFEIIVHLMPNCLIFITVFKRIFYEEVPMSNVYTFTILSGVKEKLIDRCMFP